MNTMPGQRARSPLRESFASPPHRLSSFDGQHGSGHPDPDFRRTPVKTTSSLGAVPRAAETSPAKDSMTAAEKSPACRSARSGTASESPPHRTLRTPSVTIFASRPYAWPHAAAIPAASTRPRLEPPGQAGYHHVRPVAHQIVHRGVSACTPPLSCAIRFS